jgi:hypothetical protein
MQKEEDKEKITIDGGRRESGGDCLYERAAEAQKGNASPLLASVSRVGGRFARPFCWRGEFFFTM